MYVCTYVVFVAEKEFKIDEGAESKVVTDVRTKAIIDDGKDERIEETVEGPWCWCPG